MGGVMDGLLRLSGAWWCTITVLVFVAGAVVLGVLWRELRGRS